MTLYASLSAELCCLGTIRLMGGAKLSSSLDRSREGKFSVASQQELVGFVWSVADLLRGDYNQSKYGRVVLDRREMNSGLVQCFLHDLEFKTVPANWAHGDAYWRIRDEHEHAG